MEDETRMSVAENGAAEKTKVGTYFVSNYPPYEFWGADQVPHALAALDRPPAAEVPLGLYLHIPFCRKRCRFCYFKVYTERDSSQVNRHVDALIEELTLYAAKPAVAGRKPKFVYFGGGTPSFLSTTQLGRLASAAQSLFDWGEAEEISFECEPGTITRSKLETLRGIGVTRLSLGVENFDAEVLEINGRAHGAKEIDRAYGMARAVGFPQINIDLIAGMVGETDEKWRESVRKTIAMDPDSVTLYQMELPPNTVLSKELRLAGGPAPVADWDVKRGWARYAFAELDKAGYQMTSGYTAVKDPAKAKFLYRDLLWTGADMLGVGVASLSHVQGVHFQNEHHIEAYEATVRQGVPPIRRALKTTEQERMLRELILQMKKGRVRKAYFESKYGVDLEERFGRQFEGLQEQGFVEADEEAFTVTREGLLRVDGLLGDFFLPQHRAAVAA